MGSQDADAQASSSGADAPGLGAAAGNLHRAGKESLESIRDMRRAFTRLVSADISLARLALSRAAVWMGVAVAFGASAWLLLMAALITGLHALGLSWLAATTISAAVSLVVTGIAAWRALHFFQMGAFEATRRQLSRLMPEDEEEQSAPTLDVGQVQRRIMRADQVLTGRSAQLKANVAEVQSTWKAAWTPLRILGAGLGLGFVSGKLEPEKAAAGLAARLGTAPKVLQTLTALTGLLAASKANEKAEQAVDKAEQAEAQAEQATPDLAVAAAAAAGVHVQPRHYRQPPAAEAATGLEGDDYR